VPEQEVQRGGLPVPIANDQGASRPLTLSRFQKRSKGDFGECAVRLQVFS
jgi:hypothetical protein